MGRTVRLSGAVTIDAVARRAGVSTMTVSNVVNGTGRVGNATRAKVLAAVQELDYRPNLAARRLVGAIATRIGLVYRDVDSPFIGALLVGASVAAAARGLQLLMGSAGEPTIEGAAEAARGLIDAGADALLLSPPYAELLSGTAALGGLNVPVAAIATGCPLPDMPTIRIDNRAASRALTQLLLTKGHRHIGVVSGPSSHSDSGERLEGHRLALQAHGLAASPELQIEGDFTFASGLKAADTLLDLAPRPTAIVAANDDMAAGVLWAAHRRGLVLPGNLAVTGFDDTLLATRVWPALTVVRQPIATMADRAIGLLASLTRQTPTSPERDVVLGFELIERLSTAG